MAEIEKMEKKELIFETRELFRKWLESEGETSEGVRLIFAKNNALTLKTLSAHEALEEALCFGWIDGHVQPIDGERYKKYFARRKGKSNWSERNKELVRSLIERGLMTQRGIDAISCAKQNGQWENPRPNTASVEQVQAFRQLIESHEPAYKNLLAMSDAVQRTYTLFYLDAKLEKTRKARLEKIIDRLNKNLKPV